jgi:hypothetical protein
MNRAIRRIDIQASCPDRSQAQGDGAPHSRARGSYSAGLSLIGSSEEACSRAINDGAAASARIGTLLLSILQGAGLYCFS